MMSGVIIISILLVMCPGSLQDPLPQGYQDWLPQSLGSGLHQLEELLGRSSSCPEGFENIAGCCYHFSIQVVTWQDAWNSCQGMNNYAVEPISLAELGGDANCNDDAFMKVVASKDRQWFWLGARRTDKTKSFVWQAAFGGITPTRVLPHNSHWWAKDYPLNLDNHNCVMSWPGRGDQHPPKALLGNDDCTDGVKYACQTFPNRR